MQFVVLPNNTMVSLDRFNECLGSDAPGTSLEVLSIEQTPGGIYRSSFPIFSDSFVISDEKPLDPFMFPVENPFDSLMFHDEKPLVSSTVPDEKPLVSSMIPDSSKKHSSLISDEKLYDKKRKHTSLSSVKKKYKYYKRLYGKLWKCYFVLVKECAEKDATIAQLKTEKIQIQSRVHETKNQSMVIDSLTQENNSLTSLINDRGGRIFEIGNGFGDLSDHRKHFKPLMPKTHADDIISKIPFDDLMNEVDQLKMPLDGPLDGHMMDPLMILTDLDSEFFNFDE